MPSHRPLPGLERLLEVCRARAHPVKLEPPVAPGADALVAGQPLDAQLAAIHARANYLWVHDELYLFPARHVRRPDLHRVNAHWRQDWEEPFASLLVFGKDDRLAYCYATVPWLAEAPGGPQPVVWVDVYETLYAIPVASSVDGFLATYARYLDVAPSSTAQSEDLPPPRSFPWDAGAFIAQDLALVRRVEAGHFDGLLHPSARARDWMARRVLQSARQ
ncbi:hypothetical protein [Archangium primigenium]|uniref:hypothetical protein n=1 Tax=[Archangium] primigenium TaxID=2792470 RepID=UPI00195A8897|nr:hypothetical protein [Archangium primigenium]MBM7113590.1 hypothetical protein [Archangium primigenium]